MRKRWIGYGVWLLLAAGLYFFENNTGTRIILICSVLVPLIPMTRRAFFAQDEPEPSGPPAARRTVSSFVHREEDEPGEIRLYQPGDPVHRIHWKLSAKRDELLIRETETSREGTEEKTGDTEIAKEEEETAPSVAIWLPAAGLLVCLLLLLLIPGANRGAQALLNRVFAASEQGNAYAYQYYPVPADQPVWPAVIPLAGMLAAYIALMILRRSRWMALLLMAGCTLFQVYFGLPFPGWVNVPLYGGLAAFMIRRPWRGKEMLVLISAVALISLLTALLWPGVDGATEAASEAARDRLSRLSRPLAGVQAEMPEGETETRHVHTRSLEQGDQPARTEREYRLVTLEEEQIAMPHWVNVLKIILLLLLSVVVVILPFAPFLLLNARGKKARRERMIFGSEDVSEAVSAIFRRVILWLTETGRVPGNLLYRDMADHLPPALPEGYGARFARCAEDFEEAAYSDHELPEETRRRALELLKETEEALWKTADRRTRLRLKYWMGLCE